jgi:ABC-type Mn2+/Zn2+ transport system permease subunit
VFAPFGYEFVQRGVLEVLLLSAGAGVLGTWAVMRGLAFYSHAVAAAAFPGLVLAAGLGFAPLLGAMGTGAVFAAGVGRLSVHLRERYDALTALALVGALAVGTVLASNVFHSGAEVDTLLFGSLIGLSERDVWLTALVALGAVGLDRALRRHWLAAGFERSSARALGLRPVLADRLLLAGIAAGAVVALDAVGALLVTVVLVVPAATVRLLTDRLATLQAGAVALAAVEGVAAVWLADAANVGAGPALAVIGGGVFALVAVATATRARAVA